MKKLIEKLIFSVMASLLVLSVGTIVKAADSGEIVDITPYFEGDDATGADGNYYAFETFYSDYETSSFTIDIEGKDCEDCVSMPMTVTSSNTAVFKPTTPNNTFYLLNDYRSNVGISYTSTSSGVADVTVTCGDYSETYRLFIHHTRECSKVKATKKNHNTVKLSWTKDVGVTGYMVYCYDHSTGKCAKTLTVKSNTNSCSFTGEYGTTYDFLVYPYVYVNSATTFNAYDDSTAWDSYSTYTQYTFTKPTVAISKVATSTGKAKISWAADSEVKKYAVYVATSETGDYTRIKTTTGTSLTYKCTGGVTYYFKLRAAYGDVTVTSTAVSGYVLPKSIPAKATKKLSALKMQTKYGQYSEWYNWSCADTTYMYTKSGALHIVCIYDHVLRDYTLTKNKNIKSTKTVKLGSFDEFGAFYYGKDGNYYVAVGYDNLKESTTKVVIKVYQYNSSWKKQKTCYIRGSASNSFTGIYIPFDASNCRMDMNGSRLYLFTGREMFAINGVNHQSNIGFSINTNTMKASAKNMTYCSHSFNQFIKFKDGNAYQVDHGDAYSRAVVLTITNNYGKSTETTESYNIFKISGSTGDNYTGLNVGGMEVGIKNVITAGISVPQGYKVDGVTGANSSYCKNVFICVTNKTTGKTTRKWLTTYNPKTSKTTVSECRLVKISDHRFAVLYTTTTSSGKVRLHYVLINNNGTVVCKKTYSGMTFYGGMQPVVYKGSIVWADSKLNSNYSYTPYIYSIPIVEE